MKKESEFQEYWNKVKPSNPVWDLQDGDFATVKLVAKLAFKAGQRAERRKVYNRYKRNPVWLARLIASSNQPEQPGNRTKTPLLALLTVKEQQSTGRVKKGAVIQSRFTRGKENSPPLPLFKGKSGERVRDLKDQLIRSEAQPMKYSPFTTARISGQS